jgi:hypothetical protein
MRRLTRLGLPLALALTVGCDGDGLVGPNFERQLVFKGGCGDIVFYAVDDDDELMLTFVVQTGLVEQARDAGQEVQVTLQVRNSFGMGHGNVRLEQGTRVSDVTCDDVAEQGGPQIRRSWTATAGSATVTVRPLADQDGAMADLLLENVTLQPDGDGRQLLLDRMEWTDVFVGWYAG